MSLPRDNTPTLRHMLRWLESTSVELERARISLLFEIRHPSQQPIDDIQKDMKSAYIKLREALAFWETMK